MQKEVDVRVDEARKKSGVAEVNNPGVGRVVYRYSDGTDAIPFDENFAGPEQGPGVNLEKPRGVEDNGPGRRLLCGGEGGKESYAGGKKEKAETIREVQHGYDYNNWRISQMGWVDEWYNECID
jgi:hypothetical protein